MRPASALAVAAALPGGDPLAAALAAGETPSPEMVAEAGQGEGLPVRVGGASAGGDSRRHECGIRLGRAAATPSKCCAPNTRPR